jgi:hypothetical protein
VNLDWRRLKAVVLESDDWGLCAWAPDEQAFRVLADTPAWRTPPGRIYGRSTLESANDVARLAATLLEFRGADGLPPVWQANTVMASPDYIRLRPPLFECETLPLVFFPDFPTRWQRPGLWNEVRRAIEGGVWWPELHGLVHLPQNAWLLALRRGAADARRAHGQESFVCGAVEAAAEYDPCEPAELRRRSLALGAERFRERFGRAPASLCPPDYRWDRQLESDAESLGITLLQGKAEQAGHPFPRLRHWLYRHRWPDIEGRRLFLPPRIAFEPRGEQAVNGRLGAASVHARIRAAWNRGQPAVVSSHRVNYAHLDAAWADSGRAALRDLLARLAADGAVFLTDAETRDLAERGWSVRRLGERGAVLRHHGAARERLRFAVPARVATVSLEGAEGSPDPRFAVEGAEVIAEVGPGTYRLAWGRG